MLGEEERGLFEELSESEKNRAAVMERLAYLRELRMQMIAEG